jgi:molybdate transport system ATP-binding protein
VSLDFAAEVVRGEFHLNATVSVGSGEVVALLGPNGAGKTTMLRAVAGLLPVDRGRVALDDIVLDDPDQKIFVPADRRRIGVVFQDHRLFPHLRVIDNVAFGLRSTGVSRSTARAEAKAWLERLQLGALARRRPRRLSGGQSQRVALARALASRPLALLLDEPLAALDVQTRAEVQGELREHLGRFGGPTLLVTHDPIEALLLATRIVVLERGVIVQQGSAAEIATRPVTPYVARLVGVNLYPGTSRSGTVHLDGGGVAVTTDAPDGRVLVAVRPSAFTVHSERPAASSARNVWDGTVVALAPLGDRIRVTVEGAHPVLVDVTAAAIAELAIAPGDHVWLTAKATDLTAYPAPVAT